MNKKPFIPILDSEFLNTKAGFKMIYNKMLFTNDFNKAMNSILLSRKANIVCIETMLYFIKSRYEKEEHDYIHALFNNNINN